MIPADLQPLLPKAMTFTFVMLGLMTASGLYDLEWQGGVRALLQRLGLSFGLGLVAMSLLFYFFPPCWSDAAPSCCRSASRCWAFCSAARCSSAGCGRARSKPAPW